jgi:hypothetical protein
MKARFGNNLSITVEAESDAERLTLGEFLNRQGSKHIQLSILGASALPGHVGADSLQIGFLDLKNVRKWEMARRLYRVKNFLKVLMFWRYRIIQE